VSAQATAVDASDVQGLVVAGYRHLRAACFLVLAIDPAASGGAGAARAWLRDITGDVSAADGRPEGQAVHVALTYHGLLALGLANDVAGAFSNEFIGGMAVPHRSRVLGDVGDSAPEHWQWGGPTTQTVDALLMLYAADEPALEALYNRHRARLGDAGLTELRRLDTVDLGDVEPFNFADGISQPTIEGLQPGGSAPDTIKAGEFVLGYPNEYGLYTDTPTVPDDQPAARALAAHHSGNGRDLGRNGTYLVLRQLAQDSDGFWAFLDEATRQPDGTSDRAAATKLAAKMVGRWPGGAPLVLSPDLDDPNLATANDFGYSKDDPQGLRCPIGAHIRRANPRDSLPPKPGTDASLDVNKRHRLIRRGREQRGADGNGAPKATGLHFIALNANIARQFEFIQGTWINNPKFDGLYDDRDPVVSSVPDRTFRVSEMPVRSRVTNLPAFVKVEGGAYFFLPGISALRYLAALD
jgi:deferrochelatase/peroxidase EfeB